MDYKLKYRILTTLIIIPSIYFSLNHYSSQGIIIQNGAIEYIPILNNDFSNMCNEIQFQCKSYNPFQIDIVQSITDYRIPDDIFYLDTSCKDKNIYDNISTFITSGSYGYLSQSLLPGSVWHLNLENTGENTNPFYVRLMDKANFDFWKENMPFVEEIEPIKVWPKQNKYIPLKISQNIDIPSYKKRQMVVVIDYNSFNYLFPPSPLAINIQYIVKPKAICQNSYKKYTFTCENHKTPWLTFPENGQGIIIRPQNTNSFVDKFYCR